MNLVMRRVVCNNVHAKKDACSVGLASQLMIWGRGRRLHMMAPHCLVIVIK